MLSKCHRKSIQIVMSLGRFRPTKACFGHTWGRGRSRKVRRHRLIFFYFHLIYTWTKQIFRFNLERHHVLHLIGCVHRRTAFLYSSGACFEIRQPGTAYEAFTFIITVYSGKWHGYLIILVSMLFYSALICAIFLAFISTSFVQITLLVD